MSVSKGNTKVPYGNVSLPPIKSCGNCKGCRTKCYALKSYRMYPSVRKSWDENLTLARQKPSEYFNMVRDYLAKKPHRFFRWHVSGDILNQRYLGEMFRIALEFPNVRFLAFTKMYHLDYTDKPANITIVFSAWPGQPIENKWNFPVSWVQDGTETRIPDNAMECPGNCGNCGACWELPKLGRDVFFHIH